MNADSERTLLVRNFGFWAVAAVLYPIAHWIPTSTGHPPRIFDVLIPIFVVGVGFASTVYLGTAISKLRHRETLADAEPGAADRRGR
jgi:hypothetical protein